MKNKVVLITGRLTGIGRATALAFAQEGASIVVSGRHEEEGHNLVGEIGGSARKYFGGSRRIEMNQTIESKNKALVLEAFDTLFNRRDYVTAERYWSNDYIQHSAHIEPGREGLFNLIKSLPPTLRYEPGTIVGEGDLVIVHGRFSGFGAPVNWIAADIVRIKDNVLVEHWMSFRMK